MTNFMNDIEIIYTMTQKRDKNISEFYDALKDDSHKNRDFLESFLNSQGIKIDYDSLYAIASRLVNLRDDSLIQTLKKQNFSEKDILIIKENSYLWVKDFYLKKHKELINEIISENLLTPFYCEVLNGVHSVGIAMSKWQSQWTAHIIERVNEDLKKEFKSDENVYKYLDDNFLNADADRSYSTLVKDKNGYSVKTYIDAFEDTTLVVDALGTFVEKLDSYEDNVFNQKEQYIKYLTSLIVAFKESDNKKVVELWADVDRAWMDITTPIQIGHPLEYYEDHYRKAVALEWDIRLSNPKTKNSRVTQIKSMFNTIYSTINEDYNTLYEYNLANLDKVQLYLGRPLVYYGAEFNGLFSAQVVPNDENVTKEFGKKIFAFADKILQNSREKPFMKLSRIIYGDEFVEEQRNFLLNETEKWHTLYDISTIGHEYGHTLWMADDTEAIMNKTGNFKNIEEFKATTGGLVSFFLNEEQDLELKVLTDLVKRAVGLIAWMEVAEVRPYYCEGLIHLDILFESGVLSFENNKLTTIIDKDSYKMTKELYIKTYTTLVKDYYLKKVDASEFLSIYAKDSNNKFLPTNAKIKEFVLWYFEQYKEFGTVLDDG